MMGEWHCNRFYKVMKFNDLIGWVGHRKTKNKAKTASVAEWSARLTTHREVADSILDISTILNAYLFWNGFHPASRGKLGNFLVEKYRIWLRKLTYINLKDHYANHIIPSYFLLLVSCRSLVECYGSFTADLNFLRSAKWSNVL